MDKVIFLPNRPPFFQNFPHCPPFKKNPISAPQYPPFRTRGRTVWPTHLLVPLSLAPLTWLGASQSGAMPHMLQHVSCCPCMADTCFFLFFFSFLILNFCFFQLSTPSINITLYTFIFHSQTSYFFISLFFSLSIYFITNGNK